MDETQNLQQQLEMHRRLAKLEEQAAAFGLTVDPRIQIEIEDITKKIAELEEKLNLHTKRSPGALPPIWNVPHLRNPNFIGRGDLLAELEQTTTTAITQAIAGLGGVGKTQLATEYAYRHAADFALVWWVRAEQELSLRADLAGLAAALGLEEAQAQEQQVAIDAALRWLERKGTRWLLVFDNVNFPHEVKPYLPQGGDGKVIVTSRYNGDWRGVAKPLQVQVWEKNEAIQFLLNRSEKDEPQAAEELAAELDCLPLALEHAAAFVAANRAIGVAGYLRHYREKKLALLAKGQLSQDYHNDIIMTTWEIAFEKLDETARDLFNLCAFLSPDEIPFSLFVVSGKGWKKYVALPTTLATLDEVGLIETAGKLAEYSLVEIGKDAFMVHKLVQGVGRERLNEEERKEWASRTARLLGVALHQKIDVDKVSAAETARLHEHMLAAAAATERLGVQPDATIALFTVIALYLKGWADYQTYLALNKRILAFAEKVFGPESENTEPYINKLGLVLQELGDLKGAKELFEQALSIGEKIYGNDHPNACIRATNLGSVLQKLGDYEGAKALYERVIKIYEKVLGENHRFVAYGANNLGLVLQELGDYQGAKHYLERAMSIDEKIFGNNHLEVAIRANNLGSLLYAQGDYAEAKPYFVRALAIRGKYLGEEHPSTKNTRSGWKGWRRH